LSLFLAVNDDDLQRVSTLCVEAFCNVYSELSVHLNYTYSCSLLKREAQDSKVIYKC